MTTRLPVRFWVTGEKIMNTNISRFTSSCILLLTAASCAQVPSDTPQATTTASFPRRFAYYPTPGKAPTPANATTVPVSRAAAAEGYQQYQQQLREALANPQQRPQLIAQRTQEQRQFNADLARAVGLDAGTYEKLLAMLVDETFANQLRSRPESPEAALEQDTRLYDEHVLDVAKIIGAERIEAYVDFNSTLGGRIQAEQFDALLPATAKLSVAQKQVLAPLLTDRVSAPSLSIGNAFERVKTAAAGSDEKRFLQLNDIVTQEETARIQEAANREQLQRVAAVLTAEQAKIFEQRLRDAAGVSLEELPNPSIDAVPPQVLQAAARLELKLSINGTEVTQTLTTRGDAATVNGPEGLLIEVRPSQVGPLGLGIALKFYDPTSNGRRLIGASWTSKSIDSGQQPNPVRAVLHGRKAYVLSWDATAAYL
jgi:hypothetical protein